VVPEIFFDAGDGCSVLARNNSRLRKASSILNYDLLELSLLIKLLKIVFFNGLIRIAAYLGLVA